MKKVVPGAEEQAEETLEEVVEELVSAVLEPQGQQQFPIDSLTLQWSLHKGSLVFQRENKTICTFLQGWTLFKDDDN